jgi:Uma2 family endonuclease
MTAQRVAAGNTLATTDFPDNTMPQVGPASRITGEELFAMGEMPWTELVKGEIVPMAPTGHPHGFVEFNFGRVLGTFVYQHKLGRVLGGEVGIYTGRDPDTVRAADVAFISNERMASVRSQSYLDVAPELIVKVMSPDDRWSAVHAKLAEYFRIGVQLIWVADPGQCQVHVYRSPTRVEILTVADELSGEPVLPAFKVAVAELFDGVQLEETNQAQGGTDG